MAFIMIEDYFGKKCLSISYPENDNDNDPQKQVIYIEDFNKLFKLFKVKTLKNIKDVILKKYGSCNDTSSLINLLNTNGIKYEIDYLDIGWEDFYRVDD